MKKITFLWGLLLLFTATLTAQQLTPEEVYRVNNYPQGMTMIPEVSTMNVGGPCDLAIEITSGNIVSEPIVCGTENLLNSDTVTPFCEDDFGTGGIIPAQYGNGLEATYTYTPGSTGTATLTVDETTWAMIQVFENGCPLTGGSCVTGARSTGDTRTVTWEAQEGVDYFIWIDTWPAPASPCVQGGQMTFSGPEPMTGGGGTSSVIIDFEGPGEDKGSYASGTVNLSGFDFDMTEALIGSLANDFFNGTQSARFRGRDGSSMTMLEDKPNGLGEISFLYRQYGTDGAQQPWAVEYSTNQGADWTQIGDPFTATDVVQTFSETVEVEGDVRFRIVLTTTPGTSGNRRMNVDDIELTDFVAAPATARVQVIHNSADPAAEFVDVYLDDVLLLEDFEFRTSTPFVDVPAGAPVSIDIAPAGSTSSGDSIYNLTATLDEGETYLVIATGVIDPSQFDETVNSPIDFSLEVYGGAREAALDPAETDVLVHHGSTDAPTVDVVETSVPVGIIVDDISFPEFQGYLELIPDDYEIDITNADGTVVVASYGVPLTTLGLDGSAITVLASGFLDPAANQDGAAFGLWVSLASGGALVELPLLGIPNEECEDAIALTCGDVVTGTTSGASNSGGNTAGDVFYSYTGSGDIENVTISLCDGGTTYDSLLRVFSDCTLTNEIAVNDDFCGLQSELTFESDGVSTYIIMVEGFGSSEGEFSLEITCELPPPPPACGDVFTDTGGPDGDYSNNEDITWTITPDEVDDFVTVIFTEFDVEANWDALYVYDGPDTSSPLISSGNPPTTSGFPAGGFYGTDIPGPFASTHPSGALTFRFLSDGSVPRPGWVADVVCAPVPPPNDLIENAISVTAETQPYTDPEVRLQYATNELLNPDGCAIAGTPGVWYSFTAEIDGTAEASITDPAGASFVLFYEAPSEDVGDETDLSFSPEPDNQCGPSTASTITTVAGQSYYIFVLNNGGPSDVVIDISGSLLSTIDNTIDGFTFYPNPAMDVINMSAKAMLDNVSMYNMLGQKVLEQNIGATTSQLDVANLASGTYLMKVSAEGQTGTYQIIKR
tara:strand:- start:204355 stop:207537 length:3183 start_codon:yes stop_codon:yes gene_type:complete